MLSFETFSALGIPASNDLTHQIVNIEGDQVTAESIWATGATSIVPENASRDDSLPLLSGAALPSPTTGLAYSDYYFSFKIIFHSIFFFYQLLICICLHFKWWSLRDSCCPMAKSNSLEPVHCSGISGAICNLRGAGFEEDFDDNHLPWLDTSMISHLFPKDLEVKDIEGDGFSPPAINNVTLQVGILHIFTPLSYSKNLYYIWNLRFSAVF